LSLRIAHVSDVHIRTLKYHDEYRNVFSNLYRKLEEIKPDLIVETGDIVHSKTNVTCEQFDMEADHFSSLSRIADLHIIPGNHDLNLMNLERQDAITPVINSLNDPRIFFHKKSGLFQEKKHGLNFWVFSLADVENYPTREQWRQHPDSLNIGLFHGSIATCLTDGNFRMTQTEYDRSLFDGLDYVLLGDIHKQQFFGEKRKIGYAGSLIQQNFGEELDKGFLVWDIEDKDVHSVTSVFLTGSRKFYSVKMLDDLSIPPYRVEPDSRVRIIPPRALTLAEQKDAELEVRRRYRPHDIITLSPAASVTERKSHLSKRVGTGDLRQTHVQERLIREFVRDRNVHERVLERMLDMNKRYQVTIDQKDDVARNVSWKLNRICWDNVFNYGVGNVLDLTGVRGVVGLFAPNASGKSNLIDIILETLYDATTRGVSRNVFLVNDNKERATMVADVSVADQDYVIERSIDRIKYVTKGAPEREWGKTSCDLFMLDKDGEQQQLTGVSRHETERAIRQRIGSYDDLMLTSVTAQWNPSDIISCKETLRRSILCRFLDLDFFEQKHLLAKEESKVHFERLKEFDEDQLRTYLSELDGKLDSMSAAAAEKQSAVSRLADEARELGERMVTLASQKVPVETLVSSALLRRKVLEKEGQVRELESKLSARKDELSESDDSFLKVIKLESRFDLVKHEHDEAAWRECVQKVSVARALIEENERMVSDGKKRLRLLDEVPCGDQFPKCKFLIDAFDSKSRMPVLQEQLFRLRADVETLSAEEARLVSSVSTLNSYRKFVSEKSSLQSTRDRIALQVENAELKLSGARSELVALEEERAKADRASDAVSTNECLDVQISEVRARKSSLESSVEALRADVAELHRSEGAERGIRDRVRDRLEKFKETKETCDAFHHYIEAMGKDGIAYQVLTEKLPLINEEINKILSSAADFSVLIEDDPVEKSIRIYLQYGQYKSRLIELGSGAEKMMASIALRVALLNMSSLPKNDTFILDEGFGKLDPKNMENVNKMFDYLRSAFDRILVVSHLDVMKDMVDSTIEITTDREGYAHVELGEKR
jgi:DNA repair exonuclease SbcCD ATPase subunit/DNA repair exonuclease SbcCD nuclease subunit